MMIPQVAQIHGAAGVGAAGVAGAAAVSAGARLKGVSVSSCAITPMQ